MRASVKVVLHDGKDDNTWVTYVPLDQLDDLGAKIAAGKAFAYFISNLERDRDELTRRLQENA